ncbi:MAG: RNA 2',3'-cyclic phosphodiesterase [Anaerolineales bacterium]|nr:RNA 2',3'-cyclic phosphodiesterase [Anaerolineales bacterium]
MTTIRSFIAIELSDEAHAALADLQSRLKRVAPAQIVRWTAPESIHLTLHFLGDIAPDTVSEISSLMEQVAAVHPPFTLTLGGLGCFPNTRRPRVVWAGVAGQTDILARLQGELGEKLKTLGFTLDTRPYSPHLTLGRVKDGVPQRQLAQLGQALEQTQPTVGSLAVLPVSEISLMKSELKSAGAVYTPLALARLASAS